MAMALPARLRQDKQLGKAAVAALGLDHEEMAGRFMGKGPADRLSRILRNQEDAMVLGAAMLNFAPMIGSKAGVTAAVRLEGGLIILQAGNE